jgi:site-specific DNA-methyltransferase (adenine-specific)
MGAIIWQKKTTTNTTGGASIMGSFPFPRNGIISIDYEFILLFKKLGNHEKPDKDIKEQSKITKEEWKEYFAGHWNFGGARQDGHIAMFPEELPKRLIKMFSYVNDTVLDPFLGSGTTSLAAKNLNRNSIGYEINSEYIPIIKKKLVAEQIEILEHEYEFLQSDHVTKNYEDKIAELPYVFKDPHKFDKKIDPKKLQFGSKLDKDSGEREEYYSVKEIVSPELLILNNGLQIRLIGIKKRADQNSDAINYLQKKLTNQKVFLKYDTQKHDHENNLICYLYLKNKTFINAHLIKNGFASVNRDLEFKLKEKFIKMEKHYGEGMDLRQ